MKHFGFYVLSMAAMLTASVGAFGQAKPEGTVNTPVPSPPSVTAASTDATAGASVDPNKYVLGPGDVIFVRTWREPDFTLPVVIRPDGKISMPLIGEMQGADLTPQQLTNTLKEQLTKYINNPDVTVFVQEVRSKKYYVDGEMTRTGAFSLATPTTILEAISSAGGFKEFANQKDVRILRNGKILHFNYRDVTRGKHLEQNILVENGDHIIVR